MYDYIIVGAGPAGLFASLELLEHTKGNILIIDKGKDIEDRNCPMKEKGIPCVECSSCSIISGWGGAGAYSDGKLTLSDKIGGNLAQYIGREKLKELINYVDNKYLEFGAPDKVFGPSKEEIAKIKDQAIKAQLDFIPARIRHLGTGHSKKVLSKIKEFLLKSGVDVKINTKVEEIITVNNKAQGVRLADGEEILADNIIVAPGRENSSWLGKEAKRLGIGTSINPVDIGVRVELPAAIMKDLTDIVYESKFIYYSPSFEDKVRTFCMCPNGEVVHENNDGLITVNGHSHASEKTENTNFALLVSKTFTEPFKEPITYGRNIAKLANLLAGRILVQRLGDFLNGRRSTTERIQRGLVTPTLTDATPGDLSLVLPYRHLVAIDEMLKALNKVAPGVYSRHTLLYGVEVKFYSSRLEVSSELETKVENLYVAGDGAGITRSLMQASVSGVIIARKLLQQ